MSTLRVSGLASMVLAGWSICMPSTAAAQATVDPNPGKITWTASYDFATAYLFRGLLQDDTGVIMFPAADAGVELYSSDDDTLEKVTLHVGTWNSLNTGVTGSDGPSGKLWYESDFYTTLVFDFAPGITAGAGFTAYTSPNNSFSTVKEIGVRVAADDSASPLGIALNPYALVAFELNASPGVGQSDGGREGGIYLELGAAPGLSADDALVDVTFPVRVGLSLHDYYELAGVDHSFGYLSIGAAASVPFGRTRYGTWNVHGTVDFYALGDTPEQRDMGRWSDGVPARELIVREP